MKEMHRPVRRNFIRCHTVIKSLNDLWHADLAEMQDYKKKNKGYRYIFVVINCYSKWVWTVSLKTKSAPDVTKAMASILESTSSPPSHLQTDQGKEFYNEQFKHLMEKFGVNHYSTYSVKKAAIAERVIRTLKERLFNQLAIQGNFKWLDSLQQIVHEYNTTRHRTINMKPADVTSSTLLQYPRHVKGIAKKKPKFKEGDVVRISSHKE